MNEEMAEICSYLPGRIATIISCMDDEIASSVQEVRLNVNFPVRLKSYGRNLYINTKGRCTTADKGIGIFQSEMESVFLNICDSSVYAHEESLRQGFVTLKSGHRVGIGATAVMKDGLVVSMKNVTSLNFRISRDFRNCSLDLMDDILEGDRIKNTFILSPPAGGKTTMLRDIARNLSLMGKNVCVVDERSEISGSFSGSVKYDLCGCDVLNGYPKPVAIIQALRTLSPDVIVCDEIGTAEESAEVLKGMNSGVAFILTAHAANIEEAQKRCAVNTLLGEFGTAVILKGSGNPGKVESVVKLC